MPIHEFFATTAKCMEGLLVEELQQFGALQVKETRAGASFQGPLALAYRACLWSRIANRMLLVLARFSADSSLALYEGVAAIPWHEHFGVDTTFAVDCHVSQSQINHSHYAALKVKDAIVDHFRERFGARPSVQTDQPGILINVYLHRDNAVLSLDLSGDSLHKRAYRATGAAAPLKENLAAAVLLRAGWPQIAAAGGAMLDPMCGSGTLPIEAAWLAGDVAPGLQRRHWGFSAWHGHAAAQWMDLLAEAETRRAQGRHCIPDIRGYDYDHAAIRTSLANIERAGLLGKVHVEKRELSDCRPAHADDRGLIAVNPPYGERMGDVKTLDTLYAQLGKIMKEHFYGWRAAVLTGNPELGKHMPLRAYKLNMFYNGAIECKLLQFYVQEIYFTRAQQERGVTNAPPLPEHRSDGANMFANRLRKNQKNLQRWLQQEDIQCYRLYDADMPEYAMAIDIYGNAVKWVHVQEYAAPKDIDPVKAQMRLREALAVVQQELAVANENLFLKVRRQQKGSDQYQKLDHTGHLHEVRENGCRFLVNFQDYLDTGLFLDHRIIRKEIAAQAAGKRFLNLFAYTGTASVYAAKGGANQTTTVDMSQTYLQWARQNMALNGYTGKEHRYFQADCMEWLRDNAGKSTHDLIFLDPPSFSTSKRMQGVLDIQRDHAQLITWAMTLLHRQGVLIFSTNFRKFKLDEALANSYRINDISADTIPRDFVRNPRIHFCWTIRHPL